MHDTARETGRLFFEVYGKSGDRILDIGSLDVNGTLREFAPKDSQYVGLDLCHGPGVDMVVRSGHDLPFVDSSYDLVVSTSCFEHDRFFWLTFLEMVRVAKHYVYVSAPVGGVVHRHPIDAWRFYPDAGIALEAWANYSGEDIKLVESFVRPPGREGWSDFVAVWAKQNRQVDLIVNRLQDTLHYFCS